MQIAWNESLEFGQLTLEKMIKIVATRYQILRLKCTKFNFGWGSAPDPAGGSLQRSPRPPSWNKRPTSKRRGGDGKGKGGTKGKGGIGSSGIGRRNLGRGGEGTRPHPFTPP